MGCDTCQCCQYACARFKRVRARVGRVGMFATQHYRVSVRATDMACYHPQCVLVPSCGPVRFLQQDYPVGSTPLGRIVYVPCGNCLGCRLDRRHEVTVLQCCEAAVSQHSNWFITLTYAHNPVTLVKSDIQAFNEQMRKYMKYHGFKWRFYGCGEYGGQFGRPHFHMSVFDVPDSVMLGIDLDVDSFKARRRALEKGRILRLPAPLVDSEGREYWQSPIIAERWTYGAHKIYRANRQTFEYVAGYVVKKLTGKAGKEWREKEGKISEFQFQSRPSIGRPWFDRYKDSIAVPHGDSLVNDCVAVGDVQWRVPRLMSKWFERDDGLALKRLVSHIRQANGPAVPDRADLARRENFAKYRALQFNKERNNEKE